MLGHGSETTRQCSPYTRLESINIHTFRYSGSTDAYVLGEIVRSINV